MSADDWTFGDIPFTWLAQERNGVAVRARWQQPPRETVRPLLGTRRADIANTGYEAATITGPIFVEADSHAAALEQLSGTSNALSDGATTWNAYARISLAALVPGGAGWTGEATFIRGEEGEA